MFFKTLTLAATLTLATSAAFAQQTRDDVVQMLSDQGYTRIEVSRTLLGSLKFDAEGNGSQREIVLGRDGTIRRDRTEAGDSAQGDDRTPGLGATAGTRNGRDDDLNDDLNDNERNDDNGSDDLNDSDSNDDSNDSDSNDDSGDDHGSSDSDSNDSDSGDDSDDD